MMASASSVNNFSAMTEVVIRFEEVTFNYGNEPVFEHLSLEIAAKKITVVLGKSGSGKSSLLKLINGLHKPSHGRILLTGRPIDYNNIHQVRLKIGYAVQQIGLFPHLTVMENISLPGVIARWPKQAIRERAEALMKMVNLPLAYADKYPYQLSGGEQQRAGLCRAILLNPPVILLDEPFSSLDADTKSDIHRELLHLQQQEPRCIVLVTHDEAESKELGDTRLYLEEGTLKRID